ncbi:cytochrome P450 [Amylostereum chailletii]|nr:cytochrome P450 [Amylostereum chailletii]
MGVIIVAQAVAAVCAAAFLFAFVKFVRKLLSQGHLRVIPGPPSPSFTTGNLKQMFNPKAYIFHDELNRLYGKVIRLAGNFGETLLVVSDTKALYTVLVKEQYTFEETDSFITTNTLAFGPGLLSTLGTTHKKQRKIMNPAFSIAHMRRLIPMFQNVTMKLQKILRQEVVHGAKEIDMLEWMGKLALELIAQGGLGYTFKALEGENNDYAQALKSYVPLLSTTQVWRPWLPKLRAVLPANLLRLMAVNAPSSTVRALVDIADTMHNTSKEVWEKKKALASQGGDRIVNQLGEGKDIMSILLNSNSSADENDRLPDEQLLAQMTTFLFAATDTTSSALSRMLHQLALNPDVQEKLRAEVTEAGGATGELGHDDLNELPFLEAVCRETLRLFPPLSFVQRTARKDTVLPLNTPVKGSDGTEYSEFMVPNDTTVLVNIIGVNTDPEIWGPDAHEWNPDRWLKPLPESVAAAHIPGVYSNQLTFIGGGRACIGFKFSLLEMKVVLSQLLPVFQFSLPAKKKIAWKWGNINTPSIVGGDIRKAQLPLTVSLV